MFHQEFTAFMLIILGYTRFIKDFTAFFSILVDSRGLRCGDVVNIHLHIKYLLVISRNICWCDHNWNQKFTAVVAPYLNLSLMFINVRYILVGGAYISYILLKLRLFSSEIIVYQHYCSRNSCFHQESFICSTIKLVLLFHLICLKKYVVRLIISSGNSCLTYNLCLHVVDYLGKVCD